MKYIKTTQYKYRVEEDFLIDVDIHPKRIINTDYIKLNEAGLLLIKKYYAWDGASGPAVDTKSILIASCVHDALYQLIRMGLLDRKYKDKADLELKKIYLRSCKKNPKWDSNILFRNLCYMRADWIYYAVRLFGGYAVKPKTEQQKKILEVF